MKQDTQEVKIPSGESIRREVQGSAFMVELGWLSGMITGEGSIGAYLVTERRSDRPDLDGRLAFRVSVKIAGAMLEDLERIKRILDTLKVTAHVTWAKRRDRAFWVGNVEVGGQANVERLLQHVIPYIGSKRPQAEMMLSIIAYRRTTIQAGKNGHDANSDPVLRTMLQRLSAMKDEGKITEPLNGHTPRTAKQVAEARSLTRKIGKVLATATEQQCAAFLQALAVDDMV